MRKGLFVIVVCSVLLAGCAREKAPVITPVNLDTSEDGKIVLNIVKSNIEAYNSGNTSQLKNDLVDDEEHKKQFEEIEQTVKTSGLVYKINSLEVSDLDTASALVNYDLTVNNRNGDKTFRPYKKLGKYALKKIGSSWRVQTVRDSTIIYLDTQVSNGKD